MRRVVLTILLCFSTLMAGCFSNGEGLVEQGDEIAKPVWNDYALIDSQAHDRSEQFTTIDLRSNESTNMTWAVFDASYGGNCCEHYLATTIEGQILNIGGEYPVWSFDRAIFGTLIFPRPYQQLVNVSHLSQLTQDKKDWAKAV